jgi:SAM-dependent methyltransferase
MPTLPSEPNPRPARQSHQLRQAAESFGVDTARYDRARPRYPNELIAAVLAASPGREMLDVGCGTGIEARQFRDAGFAVLGVEPDARMAAFARQTGIEVEVAKFEDWDPAGRNFDAVVAGQSWHWVDPVAGVANAARVLRPGGSLTMFWHVFEAPREVNERFAEVYRRVAPGSPLQVPSGRSALELYQAGMDKVAETLRATGGFGRPERWRFDWEQHYTREQWLDLLPTTGGLTWLAEDKLAEVLAEVGAAIDRIGGGFTMASTTVAISAPYQGNP